jgi:hypothetical protein
MSYPTARRILEELHFLDIVDISSIADYTNSELKIILKEEYQWFKSDEFKALMEEVNKEEEQEEARRENSTISKQTESLDKDTGINGKIKNPTDNHKIENPSVDDTMPACDTVTCHTLKKNLPHTHRENIFSGAIGKKENDGQDNRLSTDMTDLSHHHQPTENNRDYIEEANYTKSSNRVNPAGGGDTGQEHSIINYNNNNEQLIDRDDNSTNYLPAPLGSKYFQRVTTSYDENDDICHIGSDSKIDTRIESRALQEVLSIIESAKGHQIAVSTAVTSVWDAHEQIRNFFGTKLTTRENRRIRDLYLRMIRHPNIEVIKYKPQLIVRWSDKEPQSETKDLDSNPL